ncbi:prolyl oligopeptidase family serine peptidase [Flavihumibacter stibioxidans]|uniref:Phospholipase n=1 Tax=Flavihumibacter stibioxidans TaxID=1834163 RepID=A0ABR7M423_9BACT|nr:prolyl oligopeptidase family serine peptidase [Flavihumibacter stibioxidans]MBC6489755.1 phospholipase [Flavihumibacter stibioxidans]
MRIILTVILFLLVSVMPARSQDYSLFEKRSFISSRGDTLPYRILYPENYDRSIKYPVVLFLHGAGERGNDNEKQLVHGGKLFLADSNRKKFPAIVIFPQCPENNYWARAKINRNVTPYEIGFDYTGPVSGPLNAALELTRQLLSEESADKRRVYITGLSMGGMGTFEAVYRAPKLFAAASPICGGGDPKAYNKKTAKVPFRIFHGAADAVVNVQLSRDMVNRLKELKARRFSYTEYPGVNHNSWDNAFAEPDFLAWLFLQKR